MGDPETQPIMMRVKSDLLDALEHAVDGTLDQADITWDRRTALGVVLASHNSPTRRAPATSSGPAGRRRGLHGVPCRHAPGRR